MYNEMTMKAVYNQKEYKSKLNYWLGVIGGGLKATNLPFDFKKNLYEPRRAYFKAGFPEDLAKRLVCFSKGSHVSLYITLLTALKILLFRYGGNEKVLVVSPPLERENCTPAKERHSRRVLFTDTADFGLTFRELLLKTKSNTVEAYKNQDYPLEMAFDRLGENIENFPFLDRTILLLNNIHNEKTTDSLNFDLRISLLKEENEIKGSIAYNPALFKEETIERLFARYIMVLKACMEDTGKMIQDIQVLSQEEIEQLLYEFNDTRAVYPAEKTIHGLFEEQVKRTPQNIAVICGDKKISYEHLNRKANSIAGLLKAMKVEADCVIGIMTERCDLMPTAILGVLKAGGAYLPLDPNYPGDRIRFMLEDSGASILLTQGHLMSKLQFGGTVINLEDGDLYVHDCDNPGNVNTPDNMAYIIYTSGTTGSPKGVAIEHRNVVRLLFNDRMEFDFGPDDIWSMFHSYCFDFSVWEMYGALLYGGVLVIVSDMEAKDTKEFLMLLKKENVTVLNQTPLAFYSLIAEESACAVRKLKLKYVIFGGEALQPVKLKEWKLMYPETRLINMYGITETTVHSTYKEVTYDDIEQNISGIGKPIPTTTAYIMDERLSLVPLGLEGELCIGGEGVGRGYINRPELTARKFVDNPYRPGERLYRSGDLARFLKGGDIEYLGRKDHQVKVRGYRIELGEIETQLLRNGEIIEAVVTAAEDDNGVKYLCAYLVSEQELNISVIREYLSKSLPGYMIPSYFVKLDKLPMTANGKVDRKALPLPDRSIHTGAEYMVPRSRTEKRIAEIWQEVLKIERVGIHDSFFDLGGHSLNAVTISDRCSRFGIDLPVRDIFRHLTIARICENLPPIDEKACGLPDAEEASPAPVPELYENSGSRSKVLAYRHNSYMTSYLFRSLPHGIILAHEWMMPWYHQHFIQLCSQTGDDGKIVLDYVEEVDVHTEVIGHEMLGYAALKDVTDIVDCIIEKIDMDQYVIICMDEYYLSEKINYNKKHFVHESLIYGYDCSKRVFTGCGFNMDNMLGKLSFGFDEVAMAYEEGKKHYKESAEYAEGQAVQFLPIMERKADCNFDISVFIKELNNYVCSTQENNSRVCIIVRLKDKADGIPPSRVKYGLNSYNDIIYALEKITQGEIIIDYRAFHLLAEHKKGLYERFKFIRLNYNVGSETSGMMDEYKQVVNAAEKIRIEVFQITDAVGCSRGDFEKTTGWIIGEIKLLKEREKQLLSEILEQLRPLSV